MNPLIPADVAAELEALSLLQVAALCVAIVAIGWAVWKAGAWLIQKFFPGVISAAQGVLAVAQVLAAAKDLPDFMASTKRQLGEIHHEVHFNNGGSVKDAVVRVERTSERLEEGVRGVHGRMDGIESRLDTVATDITELRTTDAELRAGIEVTFPVKQ